MSRATDILDKDREAIRSLTAVAQQEFFELAQDIASLNISPAEKSALFKQSAAALAQPYFIINEELSVDFYDEMRVEDGGDEFGFDPMDEDNFSRDAYSGFLAFVGFHTNDKGPGIWEDAALMAALLLLIGGGLQKSYLNARQENYTKIGSHDGQYRRWHRQPGATACSFCIRRAIENSDIGMKAKYHMNCRCGLGVIWVFSDPDKYKNHTFLKYEIDHKQAVDKLAARGGDFTDNDVLSVMRKDFGYR